MTHSGKDIPFLADSAAPLHVALTTRTCSSLTVDHSLQFQSLHLEQLQWCSSSELGTLPRHPLVP